MEVQDSTDTLPKRDPSRWMVLLAATAALALSVKLAPTVIREGRELAGGIERELDTSGSGIARPGGKVFSQKQLDTLNKRREVAGPNDGFDDLSLRANPDSDMYMTGNIVAERRYLRHELQQKTGHRVLWQGDVLYVPVLPQDD
jgi:hypothetical protein